MLRRRLSDTSAKIGVGPNRAAVATSMLRKYGAQIGVAILDDGMQHLSLLRDVDIVMINALNPLGNKHLIPRGPMREPLTALTRAHILLIHHANLVTTPSIPNNFISALSMIKAHE